MKNILGISAGFHDAGLSVISPAGDILFASHAERFSKKKHDAEMCTHMVNYAMQFGEVDTIAYYERPWLKNLRMVRSGQGADSPWQLKNVLNKHLFFHPKLVNNANLKAFGHHLSHAAAGFQTSPFDDATVLVIDAIGEFDTVSVWNAWYDKKGNAQYKLRWRMKYPDSIGMFYSAMTKFVGLRPMDEEYILMGMAAYGKNIEVVGKMADRFLAVPDPSHEPFTFKDNLHIGVDTDWIQKEHISDFDIAMATQEILEWQLHRIMLKSMQYRNSGNLVYMGGVALNCLANRALGRYYKDVWIMPNPGDAGSSLGAAALAYKKKLNWKDAYLGYNIEGEYPVKPIIDELIVNKIVGVANGRAEFGPRALGNRSLLADPRGHDIKDKVNEIKRRQQFRPFAPVILEEHVREYFNMPTGFNTSPYMQVVAKCKRPDEFPAIIHADGTSRVQTVANDGSGIRKLLEAWKVYTGCPMLLNTSLNIRGEPMVNDVSDAKRFEDLYKVKVFTSV
jgi:carbamoyltransferase